MSLSGCCKAAASAMIFTLGGCAALPVGRHHTSDAELERRFKVHRAEFEALRGEFEVSDMKRMFAGGRADLHDINLFTMKPLGLPRERATYYEDRLRSLGLFSVMKVAEGFSSELIPAGCGMASRSIIGRASTNIASIKTKTRSFIRRSAGSGICIFSLITRAEQSVDGLAPLPAVTAL
jgi:hypothetical protein